MLRVILVHLQYMHVKKQIFICEWKRRQEIASLDTRAGIEIPPR